MKKTLTISLMMAFALAAAARAQAQQDPLMGTWKLNLAKSKYDPVSLTPKGPTIVKREASGNGYKVTTDGMDAQGAATHTEYTVATLDGKDYPLTGSQGYNTQSIRKIDANTLLYVNKQNGAVVRMVRVAVSRDGKTSTNASVGVNAQGVAFHHVVVYEKQ